MECAAIEPVEDTGALKFRPCPIQLENQHRTPLSIKISGSAGRSSKERWLSLDQLQARFADETLMDIISNRHFCSHMQPIVNFSEEIE